VNETENAMSSALLARALITYSAIKTDDEDRVLYVAAGARKPLDNGLWWSRWEGPAIRFDFAQNRDNYEQV
jgi:hypothetical protein